MIACVTPPLYWICNKKTPRHMARGFSKELITRGKFNIKPPAFNQANGLADRLYDAKQAGLLAGVSLLRLYVFA